MNNTQSAKTIRDLCKSRNVPIIQMLGECGISRNFIYSLEKRQSIPAVDAFEKIADYFNVSIDYVIGRTDDVDYRGILMDNIESSKIIKNLCSTKNITIIKMLEECGINRNFIYDLEKRQCVPAVDVIEKIADYFDVSIDYIMGRTDKQEINR